MQSSVYLSYAPEDAAAVEELKSKLTVANLAPLDRDSLPKPGRWQAEVARCALFLACCGASFAQEEVARAIELLRREPRPRAWLVVVQLTAGDIAASLGGFPLVALHSDESKGIAQITSLIEPAQAPTSLRVGAGNIVARDARFNPTNGASTVIEAEHDLVLENTLVIGNGPAPQGRNQ